MCKLLSFYGTPAAFQSHSDTRLRLRQVTAPYIIADKKRDATYSTRSPHRNVLSAVHTYVALRVTALHW